LDDSRFCPQLWFDELIITIFSFDLFAFPNGNVPELQLFTLWEIQALGFHHYLGSKQSVILAGYAYLDMVSAA
jgi:hypothetical protein